MTVNPIRLADAIAKVMSEYEHANDICRAVGVNPVANGGSVAERWLLDLRDSFTEDLPRILETDYPADEVTGLESVPVSTSDQWAVWAELRLWEMDPDLAVMETGEFPAANYRTETHRAVKLSALQNVAADYEYEIASNALNIMLSTALEAYGRDDDE